MSLVKDGMIIVQRLAAFEYGALRWLNVCIYLVVSGASDGNCGGLPGQLKPHFINLKSFLTACHWGTLWALSYRAIASGASVFNPCSAPAGLQAQPRRSRYIASHRHHLRTESRPSQ